MLKLRSLTLALPLAMQMSGMSAGAVASEGADEPQVITITTVDIEGDDSKKVAEEKIRAVKADMEAKAKKARAEIEKVQAQAEKARAEAKVKAGALLEARVHPQVLTIIADDNSKGDGDKPEPKKVTVRGQFKVTSDGKTFEVVAPEEVRALHEKLYEMHGSKLPAGNRAYTIIRTKDGEETKLETDDLNKLIGELTARVKDGGDAPKFIIGVSVSEAPAVVLSQIGKPEDAAVVVDTVVDDSPAEKAGVRKFDVILKAAGEPVKSPGELTKVVKSSDGKAIELVLVRTGKELKVNVTPKSNEPVPAKVKAADGVIQFGPGMMLNRPMVAALPPGMAPGNLMEEVKALRKDIEELKKMIEELKAAK